MPKKLIALATAGLALTLLVIGIAVGDDARARLHMQRAVLDHPGSQHDARIERAVGRKVSHAAGIGAAHLGLADVTVTTASARGAVRIRGLAADDAAELARVLTETTHATPGDAT